MTKRTKLCRMDMAIVQPGQTHRIYNNYIQADLCVHTADFQVLS